MHEKHCRFNVRGIVPYTITFACVSSVPTRGHYQNRRAPAEILVCLFSISLIRQHLKADALEGLSTVLFHRKRYRPRIGHGEFFFSPSNLMNWLTPGSSRCLLNSISR
ncbi:hypothetical protein BDW66DRAFT_13272 [Aspergillus desertorum]